MASDDKAAQLLAIARAQSTPRPPSTNPIAHLRDLVDNAESESVRLQASRVLLELQMEEKRRREAKRAAGQADSVGDPRLAKMSDEALFELADEERAADLQAVLNGGKIADTMPRTREVVEGALEREVERRLAATPGRLG